MLDGGKEALFRSWKDDLRKLYVNLILMILTAPKQTSVNK